MSALLHGRLPELFAEQRGSLLLLALVIGGALALLTVVSRMITHLLPPDSPRFYDQRRLANKLSKSAYRARLRLYVIETLPAQAPQTGETLLSRHPFPLDLPLRFGSFSRSLRAGIWHFQRAWQRRKLHRKIGEHLAAAYQQYQTAALTIHVRHWSGRRARRWLPQTDDECRAGWTHGIRSASCWHLTAEEVALLWHPVGAQVPGLVPRQERTLLAPSIVTAGEGWMVGTSEQAGLSVPGCLPPEALRQHAFVAGRTDKGKRTLFHHLALAQLHQAIAKPSTPGLVVIEPHGDLIASLLGSIPATRIDAVRLGDLANRAVPPRIEAARCWSLCC